jgi:hypothetical protein
MFVIMPVNKTLMDTPEDAANEDTRTQLQRWGRLHSVRSLLGAAATLMLLWGAAA